MTRMSVSNTFKGSWRCFLGYYFSKHSARVLVNLAFFHGLYRDPLKLIPDPGQGMNLDESRCHRSRGGGLRSRLVRKQLPGSAVPVLGYRETLKKKAEDGNGGQ